MCSISSLVVVLLFISRASLSLDLASIEGNVYLPRKYSSIEDMSSLSDCDQADKSSLKASKPRGGGNRSDALTRRRENHRHQEQHRREKINENLTQLREMLEPTSNSARCNKANVLKQCIEYIQTLRAQQRQLVETNCVLREKIESLESEDRRYMRDLRGPTEGGLLHLENKSLRDEVTRLRAESDRQNNYPNSPSCSSPSSDSAGSASGPSGSVFFPSSSSEHASSCSNEPRRTLKVSSQRAPGALAIASILCESTRDAEVPARMLKRQRLDGIEPGSLPFLGRSLSLPSPFACV